MTTKSETPSSVLQALQITRFFRPSPNAKDASQTYLDLSTFPSTRKPTPTGAYKEWMELHAQSVALPAVLLGVSASKIDELEAPYKRDGVQDLDEIKRQVNKKLARLGAWQRRSPTYLAVPHFEALYELWQRLAPGDRNLAAIVTPGRPVHFYADLDGAFPWCTDRSSPERGSDLAYRVRVEFNREFAAFFKSTYNRGPRLESVHWERAVHPNAKLSLHVHIGSEAWASDAHLKAFALAFADYLQTKRHASVMAESMLCCSKESLFDVSVYNHNSVLRLCGNCKPYGPVFEQFRPAGEAELSASELLWRGMPTLALPGAKYGEYLTMRCITPVVLPLAPRFKRSASDMLANAMPSSEVAKWTSALVRWFGPQLQLEDVRTGEGTVRGYCAKRSAWCVVQPGTHVHKSNRSRFVCSAQRGLLLSCMHPMCNTKSAVSVYPCPPQLLALLV